MIDTIIFDFGDVFINLEKQTQQDAFKKLGLNGPNEVLVHANDQFEKGAISETEFLNSFSAFIPHASHAEIKQAWNTIIGDFPLYRLEFLQLLSHKYRLFLLTNTDSIHIEHFEDMVGVSFFSDFYQCFEKVFYSYEMGMRKPDEQIFKTILSKYDLNPKKTLFVDDKKANTDAAEKLGMHIWNLQVGTEDVVDLAKQKHLPL
ncbi:putative hydrolase of the HAD superfamily [Flavobacterium croceum DSM 17960]|jgi:putative hydrolase of the HAD superfamily|uniref:Putative hydrolase of the HAD superfamily n=1 Tax=Flavobacterium croceum DSM 17960 TaxID=1121886 RepID=A0A2S4N557_9FLAO|nr:HAD family phosphatase [Flavobacterium croceum]POS00864.1 putative hydrolase of the HAD superfamily [Flavobacterium croceum DSM 17960]